MKQTKPFPTKLIALVGVICAGGLGIVNLIKDPEESLQMATKNAFLSTVDKVSVNLGRKFSESDGSASGPAAPQGADQIAARNELLRKMFLQKGQSFFTQSRWGAKPVPYELRNFELNGPTERPVNGADRKNGIDRRVGYTIKVRAYRVYDSTAGWGPWNPENPPQLDGITLVRQDGEWKVISDPTRIYALK